MTYPILSEAIGGILRLKNNVCGPFEVVIMHYDPAGSRAIVRDTMNNERYEITIREKK